MSFHEEAQPPELTEPPFLEVQRQLDLFVDQAAEVMTVFDYRHGGKRVIRQKLAQLFESEEMAGEPVTVRTSYGVGRLVDYSTNQSWIAEGDIVGYLAGFYPVPDVIPIDDLDEQHPEDTQKDGTNPVIIQLGVRFKPMMPIPGCSADHTFFEVLAVDVEEVQPVVEQHPLLVEDEIFSSTSNHLLRYGEALGLTTERLSKRLSQLAENQTEECQFTNREMVIDVFPGSHYFTTADLASARADDEPLDVGTIVSRKQRRVKLKSIDWLWDNEPTNDGSDTASLFACLELMDEADRVELGSDVITITTDSIQFGYPLNYETLVPSNDNVFAYESLFQQALIDATGYGLDEATYEEVAGRVILGLHTHGDAETSIKIPTSRTLGATVAIRTDAARILQSTTEHDTELLSEQVAVQEYQDICGRVVEYRVIDTEDNDPRFLVVCVLDVSNDRYFGAINIQYLEVPLLCIAAATILTAPDLTDGHHGLVNHSLYVHAN